MTTIDEDRFITNVDRYFALKNLESDMNQPGVTETIRVMNEVQAFIAANLQELCKDLEDRDNTGTTPKDSKLRQAGEMLRPNLSSPYLTLEGMIRAAATKYVANLPK